MGATSIWHWIIVAIVVLVLFGKGRIAAVMGDMGKGLRNFREELKGGEDKDATKTIASKKEEQTDKSA